MNEREQTSEIIKTLFVIHQPLEIQIEQGEFAGRYPSRILGIRPESVRILSPVHAGQVVRPVPDLLFIVRMVVKDVLYWFNTSLLGVSDSPSPAWIIPMPEKIHKVQRRQFVRLRTVIPVQVVINPVDDRAVEDKHPPEPVLDAFTKDLSANGMRLVMRIPVPRGTKLQIIFELPKTGIFSLRGEVVRVEQTPDGSGFYLHGVRFSGLSEAEEQKIVRFIYQRQIELRKRHLR